MTAFNVNVILGLRQPVGAATCIVLHYILTQRQCVGAGEHNAYCHTSVKGGSLTWG